MTKVRAWPALVTVVALVAALTGCERTRIADINRDPSRYTGKEITIAGEVTDSFGALNQGAYEIDDGTGRIWILSINFGVPARGARIAVTGRLQPGLTFGGRSFANILRETKPRQEAD
jgi:hypothetical protein